MTIVSQIETPAAAELNLGVVALPIRAASGDAYDAFFVPSWDEDYSPQVDLLTDLGVCAANDLPLLLSGPAGCGKTAGVQALASMLNQPLRRINLHGDVRAADFVGEKVLGTKDGLNVLEWRDGVLPDAMRRGHWILLDELDAAPPQISMTLQAVLEPGHKLCLAANHGEVIEPHPDFRIFATANTIGKGDESGMYQGTHVMNEATLDRFVVIACTYLPEADEAAVVATRSGLPLEVARKMVSVATMVRNGVEKSECFCTFSTRRLVAWAKLANQFACGSVRTAPQQAAFARAWRMAVGNKLTKEDAKYIAGVTQRITGVAVLGSNG